MKMLHTLKQWQIPPEIHVGVKKFRKCVCDAGVDDIMMDLSQQRSETAFSVVVSTTRCGTVL